MSLVDKFALPDDFNSKYLVCFRVSALVNRSEGAFAKQLEDFVRGGDFSYVSVLIELFTLHIYLLIWTTINLRKLTSS